MTATSSAILCRRRRRWCLDWSLEDGEKIPDWRNSCQAEDCWGSSWEYWCWQWWLWRGLLDLGSMENMAINRTTILWWWHILRFFGFVSFGSSSWFVLKRLHDEFLIIIGKRFPDLGSHWGRIPRDGVKCKHRTCAAQKYWLGTGQTCCCRHHRLSKLGTDRRLYLHKVGILVTHNIAGKWNCKIMFLFKTKCVWLLNWIAL